MKTFYQFLENINSNLVKIELENLKKLLTKKLEDFFTDHEDTTEELKNFKLDLNYVKKELKNYPKLNELINHLSINKNDNSWYDGLRIWQKSLPSEEGYKVFDVIRYLMKYQDSLEERKIDKNEYYKYLNEVLEKTQSNMMVIKSDIENNILNK
jgi:hypothetical protein